MFPDKAQMLLDLSRVQAKGKRKSDATTATGQRTQTGKRVVAQIASWQSTKAIMDKFHSTDTGKKVGLLLQDLDAFPLS
jgi:hypothetical protein